VYFELPLKTGSEVSRSQGFVERVPVGPATQEALFSNFVLVRETKYQ